MTGSVRAVRTEVLQVLALELLVGRLPGVLHVLVTRQGLGRRAEELADVVAEEGDDADRRDGDEGDDDDVLGHSLAAALAQQLLLALLGGHVMPPGSNDWGGVPLTNDAQATLLPF